MFREHIAWGAIVAIAVVVALYSYALVTDVALLLFLFGVTVVGSFLPDTDSDSSMPFYLVFGAVSLAATTIVAVYTLETPYAADWRYLVGIPGAALVFFWVVVGGIIKRLTHHRGMFHSLPAMAIAAAGTFLLARHYGFSDEASLYFGIAMAAGFFTHLLLDEIHAGITLDGIPFNPKSTFGGATKLFGNSTHANVATYALLATLISAALQ